MQDLCNEPRCIRSQLQRDRYQGKECGKKQKWWAAMEKGCSRDDDDDDDNYTAFYIYLLSQPYSTSVRSIVS